MPKLSTATLVPGAPGSAAPALWTPTGFAPGLLPISDGRALHLPISEMQNGAVSGVDLLASYDATSDASYVDWARLASGQYTRTTFNIASHTNKVAYFEMDDATLNCRYYWSGDVVVHSVPFDPIQHRFWRIRHDGAHIHWEVASVLGAWGQLAVESSLDWSSWSNCNDTTISVAHYNVAGAIVGESQLRSFNASTAAALDGGGIADSRASLDGMTVSTASPIALANPYSNSGTLSLTGTTPSPIGLEWQVDTAPAGAGLVSGQLATYEDRVLQVVAYYLVDGNYVGDELVATHLAQGIALTTHGVLDHLDYWVTPGFGVNLWWLLAA